MGKKSDWLSARKDKTPECKTCGGTGKEGKNTCSSCGGFGF